MNIDFETFVNGINDESKFNDFKTRINIIEKKKKIALENAALNESTRICLPKEIFDEKIESDQNYTPKKKYQINPLPIFPQEIQNDDNSNITKNAETNINMNMENNDKQPQSTILPHNKDNKESQEDLFLSLHPKTNSDLYFTLSNIFKINIVRSYS